MKLTDSFSLFLFAFKLKKNPLVDANSIWRGSKLEPEKDFLFNHVHDFFTKNNDGTNEIKDESCCVRYELYRDNLSEIQKGKLLLIHQLLSRNSQTIAAANKKPISFKIINDNSILGPSLLFNPITGIGILSFGFNLSKDSDCLEDLIELNYISRIFGRKDSAKYLITRNIHPAAFEQENNIAIALQKYYTGSESEEKGFHIWDIQTLVNVLLQDIKSENIKIISPNRLQGFTYLQTETKMNEQELNSASFRLRRMYNLNYTGSNNFLNNSSEINRTFEQILFGASIEGCAIIVNGANESLPPFLKNYGVIIKQRYIWCYLLAYFQRLALIEMSGELASLYDNGQPKLGQLMEATSNLSKIELRTLFAQVSYFSQHNDFYDFCKQNLKLGEMYGDIKEKLSGVSLIVKELENHEEKRKEKKREKKDRLLEVMIATLLIPEIIYEFLSMLYHVFEIHFPIKERDGNAHETFTSNLFTYILFGFATLLFLTLLPFAIRIYKEYYIIAKSYFKKEDPDENIGFKKHYID